MPRRFYINQLHTCWSLSKKGYLKLLEYGATSQSWDLNSSEYEARPIKKPPLKANPIDVTGFEIEHYRLELEHFLKTGQQTGFQASNYFNVFFDD